MPEPVSAPILGTRALSKAYGHALLFGDVAITVREGEKIGLIGRNGAGKSTLLRVLAGVEPADTGTVDKRKGVDILYLPQEPVLDPEKTARSLVEEGLAEWHAAVRRHGEATQAIERGEDQLAEQVELSEEVERLGGWSRGHVVEETLLTLGVRDMDRPTATMSGGEKRRVALARLLVARPALAILDEPTNHLDADTVEWLEEYLVTSFPGAVLLVTHDRYVLDAVCDRIFELDPPVVREFEGGYGDYLEQKAELLAHAARVEDNRLNFLRRETAWLRRGAKARSTKQKARIQRAEAVIAAPPPKELRAVELRGLEAEGRRLGKTILELSDVHLSLGERELISGLTLHMVAQERIGILGPNGAGKTSLLKLVTGELAPTSGAVVLGKGTSVAHFDQARAALVEDWTVFDNVAEREGASQTGGGVVQLGDRVVELRSYLEQLGFDGHMQRKKVSALSGGERARVALAKTLKSGANMLLLDEPTNDLDTATLAALEDLLCAWPGCALIVTHDRWFMNRVATSILAFEGDGKVVRYPGNYDTYRSLRPDLAAAAAQAPVVAAPTPPPEAAASTAKAGAPKKSLTYAERIELEGLLDKVSEAEDQLKVLEAKLSEPFDAERTRRIQADHAAAEALVQKLTTRWEDLEARKG